VYCSGGSVGVATRWRSSVITTVDVIIKVTVDVIIKVTVDVVRVLVSRVGVD
jgi:hypothetical protein